MTEFCALAASEERWQTTPQSAPLRPVPATTTEPPAQAPKAIRTARAEPSDHPVSGNKGRRYFYIGTMFRFGWKWRSVKKQGKYYTPKDMLTGRQQEFHGDRDRKLEAARQIRRQQAA